MSARGRLAAAAWAAAAGLALSGQGCADLLDIPSGRVLQGGGTGVSCAAPADCKGLGATFTCSRSREKGGTCVDMASDDCKVVHGLEGDGERAVYIGLLGPLSGESASTGRSTKVGALLALTDVDTLGGLPAAPSDADTRPRPLVLIACDDAQDPLGAAGHLVETVGVPVIVGPSFSGDTLAVAPNVTVPNDVLTVSGSATSVSITTLANDKNLVWRTAPPDTFQAKMFALLFSNAIADVEARYGPIGGKQKVLLLHKGDAAGQGLADDISRDPSFLLNGAAATDPSNRDNFRLFDNGVEGNEANPLRSDEAVQAILSLKPHVVFGMLTGEAVDIVMRVEEAWGASQPAAEHRPRWLFNDGVVVQDLWDAVGDDDDLRQRVLLGRPGKIGKRFEDFSSRYRGSRVFEQGASPEVLGAATGYDAMYMLMYALSALPSATTGVDVRDKLKLLLDTAAPAVETGRDDFSRGVSELRAGRAINLQGVSGQLDLDPETGEGPSDIQLLCMPLNDGRAGEALASGLFLNADTNELSGSFNAATCNFAFPGVPAGLSPRSGRP